MIATRAATLALAFLAGAAPALAQPDPTVQEGLANGTLGERADGYVGFAKPARQPLRVKVEAINAQRRENYAKAAKGQGVTTEAYAASVGCRNLTGLAAGRAYSVADGSWAVKADAPLALPATCSPAAQ